MSFSNYLEQKLAEHSLGITNFTMPSNIYLALVVANLDDSSNFTNEVSAGDYNRLEVTGSLSWAGGQISNSSVMAFPTATNDWGDIHGIAICDSANAGNILYFGNFPIPKTINTGDVFALLVGTLKIILD